MTSQDALVILALVTTAYPEQSYPPETIDLWTQLLAPYDFAAAQIAVPAMLRERYRAPNNIADLTNVIGREMVGAPSAGIAWSEILTKAVNPDSVTLHPLVRQALRDIGGLWAVRNSENQEALSRYFIRQYEALLREAYRCVGEGRDWRDLAPEKRPEPVGYLSTPSGG